MKGWFALPLAVAASGCDGFPRDSGGTLEQVRGRAFSVGRADAPLPDPQLDRLIARLARRTDAQPAAIRGEAEWLLMRLEAGELDLVTGVFDENSSWARRVTFSRPVRTSTAPGDGEVQAVAATRNGEHAWAMEVDRAVADLTAGGS